MSRPITLFFCIILIIALLFSGCYAKNIKESEEEKKQDTWQGIITLWDFPRWPDENGNRFGWIQQKIAEFEKTNPGVFIHLRKLKWEYGMIELQAAASTDTGPDIAPVATYHDFITKGYLEPVDDVFTPDIVDKYHPKAIEAVKYNERIYGFPWFMTTYGLFLNLDLFSKKNIEPPENGKWSFEQFAESAKALTFSDGEIENYGFNTYLAPGNYQAWGFLTMDGAEIFDEKKQFKLNVPEGISALSKMAELREKYECVPEQYGITDENEVWGDFSDKQNLAIYPAGPWAIKILQDKKNKGKGFKFDIAFYPDGKASAKSISTVAAYGIFKQKDEAKREVCKEFLKYITSEKEQENLSEYMVFPVYKEYFQRALKDPYMEKMGEILNESITLPKINNWFKIDEIITSQVRQVFLGKKTPEEALDYAHNQISKIIEIISLY